LTTTNDSETLRVLLTGRNSDFEDPISRMLNSRGLTFDLIRLKPMIEGLDTFAFKQDVLTEVLQANPTIEEVEIYEDRKPHVKKFQDYLDSKALAKFEVHLVKMDPKYLDKSLELSLVRGL